MKYLHNYIFEKLNVNNIKRQYSCCPKTRDELRNILVERLFESENADLNDIDVSEITDMSYLFFNLDPHNIDISEWNVSKVIDMRAMFAGCKNFDCNISSWNVSNDTDMHNMFFKCDSLKNKPKWYKE